MSKPSCTNSPTSSSVLVSFDCYSDQVAGMIDGTTGLSLIIEYHDR